MNWSAAEEFCVSKGGHLASVASPFHWVKLHKFMVNNGFLKSEEPKEPVWLGGTDEPKEGEWTWTDESKWSENQWDKEQPKGGSNYNCLSSWASGNWFDLDCSAKHHSICSVPTTRTLTSDTQLVFTSENISTPAIQVRWVAKPICDETGAIGNEKGLCAQGVEDQEENDENGTIDMQNKSQSNQPENRMPGFKLTWTLVGKSKIAEAKGTFQKRFSGIRPLRGGGVPPFSANEKNFFTLIFR